ncbi:MAG: molybdenum cofactor biosynthesis protein MoaE [Thermoplasmata archaeon]
MKGLIQREFIDTTKLLESKELNVGSTVTFQGIVRNIESSRELSHLFYDADEKLATTEINKILEEAKERYGLIDAIAIHRIGIVKPGETSLFVAVNSTHRKEGFDGCKFIVDAIKERLPIWKKDHFVDGTESWH